MVYTRLINNDHLFLSMLTRNRLLILMGLFLIGMPSTSASGETPIRVRENGKSIHKLPLERYVAGVLVKEIGQNWPAEAMKAQAVASRTYALYRIQHPRDSQYDVEASTNDQVFSGKIQPADAIMEAVNDTRGQVLKFQGQIFESFFHSCCGGKSEKATQVWPGLRQQPVLSVHPDPYCHLCPRNPWTLELSRGELNQILSEHGIKLGSKKIAIQSRDDSGRVEKIASVNGALFRQWLGYDRLRSTLFEVATKGDTVIFTGRGSGHGVGLCQWGAKGMADAGKTYQDILEFYYPGAELSEADNPAPESFQLPEILPRILEGGNSDPE